jgi:hypothetical protein
LVEQGGKAGGEVEGEQGEDDEPAGVDEDRDTQQARISGLSSP